MKFGKKVQQQRKKAGLLQQELADRLGVTKRTLANYEGGCSYPQNRSLYAKLAEIFNVDVNYFLTEDEEFLTQAAEIFGKKGQSQAQIILNQAAALFAGGELSEKDEIAFLHDMQTVFLESKKIAKTKYSSRGSKRKEKPVQAQ